MKNRLILLFATMLVSLSMFAQSITVDPQSLEMGNRPNNYWMSPGVVTITNAGSAVVINSIESSNPYFTIGGITLPKTIASGQSASFNVTTGTGNGAVNGNIVLTFNNSKETLTVPVTATAYNPVSPDVWELARVVSTPVNYTDAPTNLHNNYRLPGTKADGLDAVYKVTLSEAKLLTARVTNGTDSKIAVYQEGFQGQGGPGPDNAYNGYVRSSFNVIDEDFEGGVIPAGWTQVHEVNNTDWVVMTGLKPSFVPYAHSGQYNATFAGEKNTTTTKLITPVMDLSTGVDATLSFWHAQKYDYLRIYYRTSPSSDWVMLVSYTNNVYNWTQRQLLLPELSSTYQIAFEGYDYMGDNVGVDDVVVSVDNQIENMSLAAGTYYIVASSTTEGFTVNINTQNMQAPVAASNPSPASGAVNVATPVGLGWTLGNYTSEYRLLMGTTNPPTETVVDWTSNLSGYCFVSDIQNNTHYYWRVDERNAMTTTQGPVWDFITLFEIPTNLTALDSTLYVGENAVLTWDENTSPSLLGYNVYKNGVKVNTSLINTNTYTVSNLAYNMSGYNFTVTAMYSLGESSQSGGVVVYVSGNGTVGGRITDEVSGAGLAGATVTFDGNNEYNEHKTYTFTTSSNGNYSGTVNTGTYTATAAMSGYNSSTYGQNINVTNAATISNINIAMNSHFNGVDLYVSPTGFAMWSLSDEKDDPVDHYSVMLNGQFFCNTTATKVQLDVEGFVEGSVYSAAVAAVYPAGMSDYTNYNWTYTSSDNFEGVTSFSVTATAGNAVMNWAFPEGDNKGRDAWDFVKSFQTQNGGEQGVVCDNEYIYTSTWSPSYPGYSFGKYTLDGNFVESFSFDNVQGIRDLTYDGTYFYGGCCTSTLYVLDLKNKNLVNTITLSGATIRHCSYDPIYDGFWVGDYQNLKLYSRSGNLLLTAPAPLYSYGSAYYMDRTGNSHIYLFDQGYQGVEVYDYNITTNTMGTQPIFDFAVTPGYQQGFGSGLAGGAYVGEYNNMVCFFGNSQQEPDLIGIYELEDLTPVPGGVIGAMIWRDGELITPSPIMSTTYVDFAPGTGDHEYCVRVVYGGDPGYTYYAMSTPDCGTVSFEIPCDAPENLYAEPEGDGVKLSWPYNGGGSGEWKYYDNGNFVDAIGTGAAAPIYWGIKFTEEQLAPYNGRKITQVSLYDHAAGNYSVLIYKGGVSSPKALVHTQNWNLTGTDTFVELPLSQAIEVETNENIWVIFYSSDIAFPASACVNTGDENGRWISFDGSTWNDILSYGSSYDFTWMIRAFIMDSWISRDALNHYNVYRGTDVNNMEIIATTTENSYLDNDINAIEYYYRVTAYYEEAGQQCESEPAHSFLNPENDYVMINLSDVADDVENQMEVYPNPVKDFLKIKSEGINSVRVYNSMGQTMFSQSMNCDETILDMSGFNNGVYNIIVETSRGFRTVRVIVGR